MTRSCNRGTTIAVSLRNHGVSSRTHSVSGHSGTRNVRSRRVSGREEMLCMFLALLVSTGLLFGSLLSYGVAMAFIVQVVARLIRTGYTGLMFWKNVAVMMIILLIT